MRQLLVPEKSRYYWFGNRIICLLHLEMCCLKQTQALETKNPLRYFSTRVVGGLTLWSLRYYYFLLLFLLPVLPSGKFLRNKEQFTPLLCNFSTSPIIIVTALMFALLSSVAFFFFLI